ncbi:MAG TPA: PDZ domain-containing protein [Anaerolineae bacterium]|nr:PDZ domain-containing protein [Anaerolineae bacterium]
MQTFTSDAPGYQANGLASSVFLLLLAVLILSLGVVSYTQELGRPALGFHWTNTNVVYIVRQGGPAERAGVREGDVFVSLNEVTPGHLSEFSRMLARLAAVEAVPLAVEREGQPLTLTLVPEEKTPSLEGWIVDYAVALVFWATGLFVYRKRAGDRAARFYLLASLCAALVLFTLLPAVPWSRTLQCLGLGLAPGLFLHLFLIYADETSSLTRGGEPISRPGLSRRPWLLALLYLPGLSFGVLNSAPVVLQMRGFAQAYDLLTLNLAVGVLEWLILVFFYLRSSPLAAGRQLEETVVGIGITALPFATLEVIDVVTESQLFDPRFLHLSAIGLPLALSYTLLKGRWAALDSFVNRGLVYTALVALLLTIYLALVEICGRLLGIAISRRGLLLTATSALIIAFLFVPLRAGLQSLMDRLFYRR